jgi:hypothetical protein
MLDGHTRKATIEDIKPGVILRHVQSDGSVPPFSDSVVIAKGHDDTHWSVVRPYAYATTSSYKQECERHWLMAEHVGQYHIVLNSKGEPYMMDY